MSGSQQGAAAPHFDSDPAICGGQDDDGQEELEKQHGNRVVLTPSALPSLPVQTGHRRYAVRVKAVWSL